MSRKKLAGIVILNALIITLFSGLLVLKNMYPDGPQTWLNVPGLSNSVSVYKDAYGIPHIYASNLTDLYFAQGYIQAEDRLFQMDLLRRAVRGTLAEIFGSGLVEQDLFLRAVGIPRAAALAYLTLNASSPQTVALLQRYVDGANFYLARHRGNLPLEYSLLELNGLIGYRVPDFNVTDVIGSGKIMAALLSLDEMYTEVNRYKMIKTFGWENASQIFPLEVFTDHPVDLKFPNITTLEYVGVGEISDISPSGAVVSDLPRIPEESSILSGLFKAMRSGGCGSNNWVVAGSNTSSGYALLANDPHLELTTPSIWHQYHLYSADVGLNVTGVTLPLAPGVTIGHNEHIAWGVTTTYIDDLDTYSLTENAEGTKYLYDGVVWKDFEFEDGVIPVFGGDSRSYRIKIAPDFGPLLNVDGYKVAMKWAAANSSNLVTAIEKLDLAKNYAEFKDAISYWDSPAQNFVYADLDGVIAFWAPGKFPIRENDLGIVPTNGSTGNFDWVNYVKFSDLPHYDNIENEDRWYFVTANARVVNASYNATYLCGTFDRTFRRDRISELIEAKANDADKMTFDDMNTIQADILSLPARLLMKNITDVMETSTSFTTSEKELLKNWDFNMAGDSPAATVWHYFLKQFVNDTFSDEFQSYAHPVGPYFPSLETMVNMTLTNCSKSFYNHTWFDDVTTAGENETMGDVIIKTMQDTFDNLYARTGSTNFGAFNWSVFQTIRWRHEMGDELDGMLGFLHTGPFPWHSDTDCVENGSPDWRPSIHFICQVSPGMVTASLVNGPGENGNIMGPNYNSQVDLYLNHQYHYMPFTSQDVLGNTTLWATFLP